MFCNKCGTKNPDDAKFCNSCGSNLVAEGTPPPKPNINGTKKTPDWKWKDVIMATIGLCILVFFLVFIFGMIQGISSANKQPVLVITPTQTTITATIASNDPIIGIWTHTLVEKWIYSFTQDGTFIVMNSSNLSSFGYGTWNKVRENEYLVTYPWNKENPTSFFYSPVTDTIAYTQYPMFPAYRIGKEPTPTPIPVYQKPTTGAIITQSTRVTIESNKDSVIKGSPVTITGTVPSKFNSVTLYLSRVNENNQWVLYKPYPVSVNNNGVYSFTIDTSDLQPGSYACTVQSVSDQPSEFVYFLIESQSQSVTVVVGSNNLRQTNAGSWVANHLNPITISGTAPNSPYVTIKFIHVNTETLQTVIDRADTVNVDKTGVYGKSYAGNTFNAGFYLVAAETPSGGYSDLPLIVD